jgi:hypothetical protein
MKKGNPAVRSTIMTIAQDREMEVSASRKIRALRQLGHQGLGLPILMEEYFSVRARRIMISTMVALTQTKLKLALKTRRRS